MCVSVAGCLKFTRHPVGWIAVIQDSSKDWQERTTFEYSARYERLTQQQQQQQYRARPGFRRHIVGKLLKLLEMFAKGKGSPHWITERRVPELIPVLGSQPAGDVSHKPGGRLPLYFLPGPQLPPQPLRGLLPISLLGEQRHDGCE